MKFRLLASALIATATVSAPVAAQAVPIERSAESTQAESKLGSPATWLLVLLALIAALAVVAGGRDSPNSP